MYKPLDGRKIRVISATPRHTPETPRDKAIQRSAAYCRVSSDKKEQETSFDSLVIYYTNLINAKPDWTLAQIYADPAVCDMNPQDLEPNDGVDENKRKMAGCYLFEHLSERDIPSFDIFKKMNLWGINRRITQTAKSDIGANAYRKDDMWYWTLTEK